MNEPMRLRYVSIQSFALVLLICSTAEARTYHVATNGEDNQSGSAEAPLATIQKAVSPARAGVTVLVGSGEYKGHVMLQHTGEEGKPIVLKNAPGEKPVLDGAGRGRIELKSEHGWRK